MITPIIQPLIRPSEPQYQIYDAEFGTAALMEEETARAFYGEETWQMILDGFHPDVVATRLDTKIH